jgi:uncharacterized protein DUF6152
VRNRIAGIFVAAAGLLVHSVPLLAHHGAASFDEKIITLKGTVTEWVWSNPHCFLKFDVKDESGKVTNWAVETQNPTSMSQLGWTRSSFKAGDVVTVTLQGVKNGAPIGRVRTVFFADGRVLLATGIAVPDPLPEK